MKYGLLKYSKSVNLGDEIQSIAAKQYLPTIDEYIDRDYMSTYSGSPIKVILNGWFMEKPENWPPSDSIDPLYISFHANSANNADKKIVSEQHKDYWKKYEPIGCRDRKTVRLFEGIGIKAYYSACLTLTIPTPQVPKTNEIIIVDPFRKNLPDRTQKKYMDQLIPKNQQKNVRWIYQENDEPDNITRFKMAQKMLDAYAGAKLVITSRIHCALPCLAFGTPVIFLDSGFRTKNARDRFDGVTDLMRVVGKDVFPFPDNIIKKYAYKYFNLYDRLNILKQPDINWDNPAPNPVDVKPLVQELRKRATEFINNSQ